MKTSESLDQLLPALISAQSKFPPIPKDGFNPHFKSRFSTLKAVQRATQPVLAAHDLTVVQFPSTIDGKPGLTTWLAHKSGQYIADEAVLSMAKVDPQAQGSAITYLRRYAWSSILGLVTDEDDDDGNKAVVSGPSMAQQEFSRVVAAAKRVGKSREDVEKHFLDTYGKRISPSDDLLTELGETVDWLSAQLVKEQLGGTEVKS